MSRWTVDRGPTPLELLDSRSTSSPDDNFLTVVGTPLTAGAVHDRSLALAGFLAAGLQLRPGSRVALLAENCPETIDVLFGTFRAACVLVPINSANKGEFLRHILADSGAEILFCQAQLADRLPDACGPSGPTVLTTVVLLDPIDQDRLETLRRTPPATIAIRPWEEAIGGYTARPVRPVASEDLAICLYTGGTTGMSKGCMLSHNVLVHHSAIVQHAYSRTSDDVLWTPLPLFHLNAIKFGVIGALLSGGRSVISSRFSVSRFWSELDQCGATIANLLGSMATLIARAEHEPLNDRLRLLVAVPLPEAARAQLNERFSVETFSGMYGMTECSTIALLKPGKPHRPDSAGPVNDEDYDVRILDEAGDEVEAGTAGEIVVRARRANLMFSGYWNNPASTVSATKDLWFRTGDIGRVDQDGYLSFIDRKGDYLRRRGENIASYEVEQILMKHPGIFDVAVHAVPSELTEDDVKITAVRSDPALTEADFFRWMVERLPYFALPTLIEFREELPRSPVGRVLKRELRAEGVTERSWRTDVVMKEVTRR